MTDQLITKYDRPVPRYTSYPSVPDWDTSAFNLNAWKEALSLAYEQHGHGGISLYIHLPYCESLCTYCGCNTRITVNHAVEQPYLRAIIREFQLIKAQIGETPKIKEIHLGGGTPTFFSPEHLKQMIEGILAEVHVMPDVEFSFEGHPNNTTKAHLQVLFELGFRRVSFGIQDSDEKVQKAINRIQPDEAVIQVTNWARAIGYDSVNFDLIYGLPFQTIKSIERTMKLVEQLRPDRIAFYSYAHVPWKRPGQRAYGEADLPSPHQKLALNQFGQSMLQTMGYVSIGMDHFALPDDGLTKAMENGSLHRNFMGYTTNPGELLIGLGVSAISDVMLAYGQNAKTVEHYLELIEKGELAQTKGHMMTPDQIKTKVQILQIACKKKFTLKAFQALQRDRKEQVLEMVNDRLLSYSKDHFVVLDKGTQFLRNVCALFDPYFGQKRTKSTFSKAV